MCGGEKTRENKKNKVWMEKMKREEKIKLKNVTIIISQFFHNKF